MRRSPARIVAEARRVEPATGEVRDAIALPPGVGVSDLEADGGDRHFGGGGRSGKVRAVRRAACITLALAALSRPALAQEAAAPPSPEPASSSSWSVGVSAGWYRLPDESDFVQPTVRADRNWLHLETRYAYEDRDALSFFAGANLEFGDAFKVALTPMIGGLVGNVHGVVPALELDLSTWKLEAYGEAEYVFDLDDSSSKYFYMWSELSLWFTDWLRAGMVSQRTRVYRTDRDIQRGPLLGLSLKNLEGTLYLFNPGGDDRFAVLSLGVSF